LVSASADFGILSTVSAEGIKQVAGSAVLLSALAVQAAGIRFRTARADCDIISDLQALGGKNIGIANEILSVIASVSAFGRIISTDPYRRIRVQAEQRSYFAAEETRIIHTLAESRELEDFSENRKITVPEETRLDLIEYGTDTIVRTNPPYKERV
jgi:hypothetical protein